MPASDAVIHGVIDIGSNAIRMYVVAICDGEVEHLSKRRAKVRLGSWVFEHGEISRELQDKLLAALGEFQVEFASHGVEQVTAIATSATREARNHPELVERIRDQLGIELSVISGAVEAELLATAMSTRIDATTGRSLWLDLGGGSVEVVTVDPESDRVAGASYPLGALRLLREAPPDLPTFGPGFTARLHQCVKGCEAQIRAQLSGPVQNFGVAGGSLETLERRMREAGDSQDAGDGVRKIERRRLAEWETRLADLTCAQRMDEFDLRPDRADTIVPAVAVTLCVAEIAGVDEILVPRVGLKDGMVERLRCATP
jgi:exopolyphosphatase/guanosine-5'-triphosphate,3'-diphosphate pyrophosphatase